MDSEHGLDLFIKEAKDYCKGNLSIFYSTTSPKNVIDWNRIVPSDFRDFLEIAKKNNVTSIYLYRGVIKKAESDRLGHVNEPLVVDLI